MARLTLSSLALRSGRTRLLLGLFFAVCAFVLGSAAVVIGGVAADPDRDAAVSIAFAVARDRGEAAPVVVAAQRSDVASLRSTGHEVPATLSGQVWLVTLRGSFDVGKRPPSGPFADPSYGRGMYSRLEVIVQDGLVMGTSAYR
jgi:hypothetical protein